MAVALILLSFLHGLGLGLALASGWAASYGWLSVSCHLYLALSAVSLALFTHSMVLFYFIGTGRILKEAMARYSLDEEIARRVRWFKLQTSGPLCLACAALIATSLLGGRIPFGGSASLHFWAGWASFLLNGWVVFREVRAIALNVATFHEVGERIGEMPSL